MDVVHERCAGLDVHKKVIVACGLAPEVVDAATGQPTVFDILEWPTSIIWNGPPVIASAVTTLHEVSRWERWDAAEEGHGGVVRGDSTGV